MPSELLMQYNNFFTSN